MTLHLIVDFLGKLKPKDLASKKAEIPSGIYAATTASEPEPKPFVPVAPKLIPCIGCRQPFLRIKRPLMLNGPKFPYENECDYCGPCRSGIFAELKEQEPNSSQPVFYNPVVTAHIEAKSTSSSTVMISSTSAAVTANKVEDVIGPDKRKAAVPTKPQSRPEQDFGARLRANMANRNEALQQSEITTKT